VTQQGTHRIHLRVAGRAVAALAMDRLEHGACGADAEAAAAVFLGDQHRQEPRIAEGLDELARVPTLTIERSPILPGKLLA
jgi:hypothetical protein